MQDGIAQATPILATLHRWAFASNMKINTTKSEAILFSYSSHTAEDKVPDAAIPIGASSIKVTPVRSQAVTKLLGLTFENRANFTQHLTKLSKTVSSRCAQLSSIATVASGPKPSAMRTFFKGYAESPILYGSATFASKATKTAMHKAEVSQRLGVRSITGVLPSTDVISQHLEANVLPLRLQATERHLRHWEKSQRLDNSNLSKPPKYLVCEQLARSLPPTLASSLPASRQLIRTRGLAHLKTSLNLREEHFRHTTLVREHRLINRATRPWQAEDTIMSRISFEPSPTLVEPDSLVKLQYNNDLLKRHYTTLAPTTRNICGQKIVIATDGSVKGAFNRGTAAAVIRSPILNDYLSLSGCRSNRIKKIPTLPPSGCPREGEDYLDYRMCTKDCGTHTCSYRTETVAILMALRTLLRAHVAAAKHHQRQHPSFTIKRNVLILTDSKSAIDALRKGPLRQVSPTEDCIWNELLNFAREGWSIHLAFVYSHCSFAVNDFADEMADHHRRRPMPTNAPTWEADLRSQIRAHTRATWKTLATTDPSHLSSHRHQLVGPVPTQLTDTCAMSGLPLSRFQLVQLARFRTGESEIFGPLYWSVRHHHNACRWCHPDLHLNEVTDVPRPSDGSSHTILRACNREGCDPSNIYNTYAVYRKHMLSKHQLDPPLRCEFGCDMLFPSPKSRARHYTHCPIRRQLPPTHVLFSVPPDAPARAIPPALTFPCAYGCTDPADNDNIAMLTFASDALRTAHYVACPSIPRPVTPPAAPPPVPAAAPVATNPPEICNVCYAAFSTANAKNIIANHLSRIHPGIPRQYVCGYGCTDNGRPLSFNDYRDRQNHYNWTCPVKFPAPTPGFPPNQCQHCTTKFPDRSTTTRGSTALLEHMRSRHPGLIHRYLCEFSCTDANGHPLEFATAEQKGSHYRRTCPKDSAPPAAQPAPPAPPPPPAPREADESDSDDEAQPAAQPYRSRLHQSLLASHPDAKEETIMHMLECPSAHMTQLRAKHLVAMFRTKPSYFFSLPFFNFVMDTFGHTTDGKESHQHQAITQKYAQEAALVTNATLMQLYLSRNKTHYATTTAQADQELFEFDNDDDLDLADADDRHNNYNNDDDDRPLLRATDHRQADGTHR
eukprot:GILJ01013563.1.p1 GENE.GILJ01013563.1~~GILJ01013563.1.p1  ORF type:complete len:1241 (-),score=135.46 GILJ01013563.1:77-3442(-)